MAYKTEDIVKKALKAIKENNLMFIEDICAFIGISKNCFYEHKTHENDELKKEIGNNKIRTKQSLRTKWYKSDNATLQLALYKLIGTEDERKKLCQSFIQQENKEVSEFSKMTDEELVDYINEP